MKRPIYIDSHVHIYPNFDLKRAIRTSLQNFRKYRPDDHENAVKVWMLTERSDCNFFETLPDVSLRDYVVEPTEEPETLVLKTRQNNESVLYILAGRQIITRQNLEVCALGTTVTFVDRQLNTADVIRAVNVHNGIAALNWAPGKWFGDRGLVVKEMLETHTSEQLFISDTTMRPTFWKTPTMMKEAMNRKFRVLCGSDPLPFEEEEDMVATYFLAMEGVFDQDCPAASIRHMLTNHQTQTVCCGKRSGPFTFARRQYKIMRHKT